MSLYTSYFTILHNVSTFLLLTRYSSLFECSITCLHVIVHNSHLCTHYTFYHYTINNFYVIHGIHVQYITLIFYIIRLLWCDFLTSLYLSHIHINCIIYIIFVRSSTWLSNTLLFINISEFTETWILFWINFTPHSDYLHTMKSTLVPTICFRTQIQSCTSSS